MKNTSERLVMIETTIVGMRSDIDEVKTDIKDIKTAVQLSSDYGKRIENLEKQLGRRWISNTGSAIAGSVLTYLVLHFLNTR